MFTNKGWEVKRRRNLREEIEIRLLYKSRVNLRIVFLYIDIYGGKEFADILKG